MKVLVLALLVSLVAVVNCQTPQQQQCMTDFLLNPDNLNVAARVTTDCANLVGNYNSNYNYYVL